ncbi:MAG TPA: dephospho-CoA kinase [Burkholderiaceae bacterium]|nr:dephospho-CoA kinase [Burkholderiaceae bacterium]
MALRLGLTGGIGSGKSTVAQMLIGQGAVLVDADAVARSVTASGGAAIEAIRAEFGHDYIGPDGAMDRERMRALAFSLPGAKQRLETIVHPLVGQQTQAQAQSALVAGSRCVVFDIPLLVETGHWLERLDSVLVVDCSVETQTVRVARRNGLSPQAIAQIIATQATRLQRLRSADAVIFNDGLTLEELEAAVRQAAIHFGL